MTLSTSSVVWVTLGAVFGLIFFLICLMSAVKAVRDRQRIKARNKVKRGFLANGQVPEDSCVTCKKLRPNLIIIHDTEKEERVKNGRRKRDSVGTTSFTVTTPASARSPDLNSIYKEITTVAEVSSMSTAMDNISGDSVDEDIRMDPPGFYGSYSVNKQKGGGVSGGDISVNVETESNTFLRSPLSSCRVPSGGSGGHVSVFSLPVSTIEDSVPSSDHRVNKATINNPTQCKSSTTCNLVQYYSNITNSAAAHSSSSVKDSCKLKVMVSTHQHTLRSQQAPVGAVSSFPGCKSAANSDSTLLHSLESQKEFRSADISPRRNSYGADLSGEVCMEVPPKRRHSDECRHMINSSMSRIYQNAVRMRLFKRDGTDNLAYEALDDEGTL